MCVCVLECGCVCICFSCLNACAANAISFDCALARRSSTRTMPERIASIADRAAPNRRSIRVQLHWACADDWHETLLFQRLPVDAAAAAPRLLSLCSVAQLSAATSIANCLVLALARSARSLIRCAAVAAFISRL